MDPVLAVLDFDALREAVGGSALTYPAIVAAVALDSVLPVAPGETVVVTAAVLAADGELSVLLVFLAGMLGGVLGDNVTYGLGVTFGRRAERRLFRASKARERVEWARDQLDRRGWPIILAARFIPGGRTATTFSAGTLGMPWRRFLAIDLAAAALWSAYATLLGYLGGTAFAEGLWKPLVAATVVAVLVATGSELLRRRKLVQ
jgi:membrane-associated protein